MRDIKFRAWDKVSRIWLDDDEYVIKPDSGTVSEIDYADGYVVIAADNHDAVLEQYTGIDDKNGVKIYKNDVVKTYAMIPGDEKYVDAVPTGVVKYYEGAYWIDNNNSALRLFQESIQIEVIGNIHENPELLGGNR